MISHYYGRFHSRDSNNIFQCIIGRSILYWPCFLDGKRFQSIRWRGIKWHGYYCYKNCLELNFHFMTGNEKRGRWPQTLGDFVHHVCDKVYKASQTLRSANGYFYWHYGQSFWIDLGNIWEQLVLLVAAHQSIPDISSGLSENSPWKLSVLSSYYCYYQSRKSFPDFSNSSTKNHDFEGKMAFLTKIYLFEFTTNNWFTTPELRLSSKSL